MVSATLWAGAEPVHGFRDTASSSHSFPPHITSSHPSSLLPTSHHSFPPFITQQSYVKMAYYLGLLTKVLWQDVGQRGPEQHVTNGQHAQQNTKPSCGPQ